jgi:REP element-mobilizing transposase RayT
MLTRFKNKFNISPTRLEYWDYGASGAYFITINTKNRRHFFGKVVYSSFDNAEMHLSNLGTIAEQLWLQIPIQFSFIELCNFVIMPNHVHGILIIHKESFVEGEYGLIKENTRERNGGVTGICNPMNQENISRIIRWYKGRCSFEMRKEKIDFSWQPQFHDHIIRDNGEFFRIRNYIADNPKNWNKKKSNLKGEL